MAFDDEEFFLSQYSSCDAYDFYQQFLDFNLYLDSLPNELKINQKLAGEHKDYTELVKLFSSFQKRNETNFLFRKNSHAKNNIIDLWLSKIIRKSTLITSCNNLKPFDGINKEFISELISKNINPNKILELPSTLLSRGIILIYEKTIPGLNVDGVILKNEFGTPIIGMSIRYNRLDNFWFTLAHELAHLLLHHEQLDTPIIDNFDDDEQSQIEIEANKLGGDLLISRSIWRSCPVKYFSTSEEIIDFSAKNNIHPAIIAGRIRKERNNYTMFNDIISSVDINRMIFNE